MNPEQPKLSSLHDDVRMPLQDRNKADYDIYPNRHPSVGERGEFSVLQRLSQFGVTEDQLAAIGVDDLRKLTAEQYEALVGEAVTEQYDLIVANAYDHWWERTTPQMMESILATTRMVEKWQEKWGIRIVERGQDVKDTGTSALISLEGLHLLEGIQEPTAKDADDALGKLFRAGIRSFGLQYGRNTALAEDGLTTLGRYVVEKLLRNGLLVDLAHSLPKTRTDILNLAEEIGRGSQVSYTHGAPSETIAKDPEYGGMAEKRGLKDEEIQRIMRLGGIVGLGITRPFFTSIDQMTETLDRLAQFPNGLSSLAIGADFGGVSSAFMIGMATPNEVCAKLGDLLASRFKFSEADIQAILAKNAKNWVKTSLKA
ncbi:MAG: membrane dipeptidase [Patescibacteria group bacterium]|jgi:microsomal dipeptidase-like Zn-dependent dipeptidase